MTIPDWPYQVAGFSQNTDPSQKGERFEGLPVYTLEELEPLAATHQAICILGDVAAKRRFVEQATSMGFPFATQIHPSGYFSPKAVMGEGGLTGLTATVTAHCRLGKHCTVCGYTQFGENCSVGDFTYIGPGVQVAGGVHIGSGVFVGIGVIISDHLSIGDGAVIGAGAVVIHDVPTGATVVGNPAREIPRK